MTKRTDEPSLDTPIVVGLDDTSSSRAALHWAAHVARLSGHPLHAVFVNSWPISPSGLGFSPDGRLIPVVNDAADEHWRKAMRAVFAEVSPEDGWTFEMISGDPRMVLVERSHTAWMLVIGTREHVGLGRVLVGSVSHYCLSHSHAPTLAIPVESVLGLAEESQGATRRVKPYAPVAVTAS